MAVVSADLDYTPTNTDQDWPNQKKAVADTLTHYEIGEKKILVTSPTGTGKSRIAARMVQWAQNNGLGVSVYCPRKMLIEQMSAGFDDYGIPHGVRAASFPEKMRLFEPVQISLDATEKRRVLQKKSWSLHPAGLVIPDEAHMLKSPSVRQLFDQHTKAGAHMMGLTATPLGLGDVYDELVVACTNSEARSYGAMLRCDVFAPDEIDTKSVDRSESTGEYRISEKTQTKWLKSIVGSVITHYQRLNPEQKPSILFAPGVKESIWFAQKFTEAGFPAAHIDGEDCWVDGQGFPSDRKKRDEIVERVRCGDIKVLCNRFVFREGVDIRELYHGIVACVFGSLSGYLQSVGRILRSHPSMDHCILQDHGGNYWRHVSPNTDLNWHAVWDLKSEQVNRLRETNIKMGNEPEPIVCAKCRAVRYAGKTCHHCGHYQMQRFREVVQSDGTLKPVNTPAVETMDRKTRTKNDTERKWKQVYYRMKKATIPKTFTQALGLFYRENYYYPPRDLAMMPRRDSDWLRYVSDVEPRDLR